MGRIGLHQVPDDEAIEDFLFKLLKEAKGELGTLITEFDEVLEYGDEEGLPKIFGYARLLNHLSEVKKPELIRMLSAAVWAMQEITNLKGNYADRTQI